MGGKVIIIGSVNVDIVARADRLPRAGETVAGGDLAVLLGGKGANQAVAAACAGAHAALIAKVGAQSFGIDPLDMLKGYGVDTAQVKVADGATGAALITVDAAGENQITVSAGANGAVSPADIAELSCDIALAQMETPTAATIAAFRRARAGGAVTILNAAPALPMPDDLSALTDILIVNETELAVYAACAIPETREDLLNAMRGARLDSGQRVIATLGAAGVLALDGDEVIEVPATKAERVVDTTGAGDCFCGTLATRLAEGADLAQAISFAAAAASVAVERAGAAPSMPARAVIERRMG
ncbi:MAG: ribokinase [Pikeienuella sp.]